jgi:predicted acylesterase/phospholipase RssA
MTYPQDPPLECDIVMKGGITSGVIYPRTVCTLAKTYRLRSVGGSSAGAIAAAGAAAAEFGRASGGFELLEKLPDDITEVSPAGDTVLFRLFQPTPKTRPLYQAFVAGMGKDAKQIRTFAALLAGFWPRALACAVPGIALLILGAFGSGPAVVAGVLGGLALALLGAALGAVWGAAAMLAGVAGVGFGLCTGMPGVGAKDAEALTPFLHKRFQEMAGRPDGPVLTFGDLAAKGIELRVMTTNLTRRQPMPMPWSTHEYFFDPDEMRTVFPPDVVDWMMKKEHAPEGGQDGKPQSGRESRKRALLRAQAAPLCPWPAPEHVPVIVATRMSLSFPLLITAVRLYAVDYSLQVNKDARTAARAWLAAHPDTPVPQGAAEIVPKPRFDRNWFSDGGICANLPVHFFDAPLPGRPTFAIDLESFPDGQTKDPNDQSKNCFLPIANDVGLHQRWTALSTSTSTTINGIKALGGFISQIVDTARGWVDAAQLAMPGHRDRVVTIYHDDTEGGMNLKMTDSIVTALAERGGAAGAELVEKFTGAPTDEHQKKMPQGWGWNNQRWTRFRTATAGLDAWLMKFEANYKAAQNPPTQPYDKFAGPDAHADLPSYPIPKASRGVVNDLTAELIGLATSWSGDNPLRTTNVPGPLPRLRLVPDDGVASLAGIATEQAADAHANQTPSA